MNQQVFELMAKESGGTSAKQTEEKICPRCGLALKRETEDLAGSGDAPVSRIADIRKMYKKERIVQCENKIITRRNGDEMEDYSIANTTKEQRIALIRQWIPDEDGLGDSGDMDLWDIYADYINGKREIAEINAEMSGTYYTEEDLK